MEVRNKFNLDTIETLELSNKIKILVLTKKMTEEQLKNGWEEFQDELLADLEIIMTQESISKDSKYDSYLIFIIEKIEDLQLKRLIESNKFGFKKYIVNSSNEIKEKIPLFFDLKNLEEGISLKGIEEIIFENPYKQFEIIYKSQEKKENIVKELLKMNLEE